MNFFSRPHPDEPNRPAPAPSPGRSGLRDAFHIFVLTTFAVTQPAYDRLSGQPGFLTDSGVEASGVLLLAAVLSLLVPAAAALCVWAIGRVFPRARSAVLAPALFVVSVLIALPIVKRIESYLPATVVIALALALAGAAVWAYFTSRRVRSVVTVAAPAIVVFPAIFLFFSPLSSMFSEPQRIRTARFSPVPVVMLVLDELSGTSLLNDRREVDAVRFPGFAELARQSTWCRNATTVHSETLYAVPALLSGKLPATSHPPRHADLPQNLFSVLASTGAYEWAVFEPVSNLSRPWSR
jgi:hypothetical protein